MIRKTTKIDPDGTVMNFGRDRACPPLLAGADGDDPVGSGDELAPVADCVVGPPLDPPAAEAEDGEEGRALEAEVEFPGHCPSCADDGMTKKLSEMSMKLPGLFGLMLVQFARI